jgi:hypothetical protein
MSAFLAELRTVLERFDQWMWGTRNSTHGVLWLSGTSDTGEDNSDKFAGTTGPYESMDMMGYAHDAERALARIAKLQGDEAGSDFWTSKMKVTSAALRARLWRDDLGAAFDRERDGAQSFVTTLVHNNVRAMWHGVFSQDMAEAFIARHLMNRSEFWTATPLPSISVSDPRFHDTAGNDWSGPPQGLTFQRAIRALESYGHHAEVLLAGVLEKSALQKTLKFPQQIDPFTSQPDSGDCYGPMLLSLLEYTAMTTGIAVRPEAATLLWSAVATGGEAPATFIATQQLGDTLFQLAGHSNGTFAGVRNGARIFAVAGNTRIVTDFSGTVTRVIGASAAAEAVELQLPTGFLKLEVQPNEEWAISGAAPPVLARKVPFVEPFS